MTPRKIDWDAFEETLSLGSVRDIAKLDRDMRRFRRNLLEDLANANLQSRTIQDLLTNFHPEASTMIASAQRDLRSIWDKSMPLAKKQFIVDAWRVAATQRWGRESVMTWLARGRVEFSPRSFPGQFVMAILENWQRFQICHNPECSWRYFFTKRSTQVYCERGECTQYSQRAYALKYWRTKGKLRREKGEAK